MDRNLSVSLFSRHDDLLHLLSALLSRQSGIEVVSATDDPLQFAEEIRLRRPSVALLDDFRVPDLSQLCRDVVAAFDMTSLVILRSPLVRMEEDLPTDLKRLELQKPVRVTALARRLEEFVKGARQHGAEPIAC